MSWILGIGIVLLIAALLIYSMANKISEMLEEDLYNDEEG